MLTVFFSLQLQFAQLLTGHRFNLFFPVFVIHGMLKFRVNYSLHQFFSNLFAGSQRFEVQLYNGVALALEDFADAVLHLCVVDAEEGMVAPSSTMFATRESRLLLPLRLRSA